MAQSYNKYGHHQTYEVCNSKIIRISSKNRAVTIKVIAYYRILYIGIEETYILMLKNLAGNTLNYSWGEANGLDSTMMELCVCPEKGELLAGNIQRMEITMTPIKEVLPSWFLKN